jgi:acetoin utilization deacetylase AcuC-like enzyme
MTLLYLNDSFANHRTGSHPECPARILRLNELLKSNQWDQKASLPQWSPATSAMMTAIHGPVYVEQLKGWDRNDAGQVEADTIIRTGSWDAAALAAGGCLRCRRPSIARGRLSRVLRDSPTWPSCTKGRPNGFLFTEQRGNRR